MHKIFDRRYFLAAAGLLGGAIFTLNKPAVLGLLLACLTCVCLGRKSRKHLKENGFGRCLIMPGCIFMMFTIAGIFAPFPALLVFGMWMSAFACCRFSAYMRRFRGISARVLVAMAWLGWFLLSSMGGAVYYGHRYISNQRNLKNLALAEMKQYFKPGVKKQLRAPRHIEILLPEQMILIKDWEIPDISGKTLASIERVEIFFSLLPTERRIEINAVYIYHPRLFLRRDSNGRFNFDIFNVPTQTEKSKPSPIPELYLKNGEVCVNCEGITAFDKPFAVKDVKFELRSDAKDEYRILGEFSTELTGKVTLAGSFYPLGKGLRVNFAPFEFPLETARNSFSLPVGVTTGGKVRLEDIVFYGLSAESPNIQWQGKVIVTEGRLNWLGMKIGVTEVKAGVDVHNEKLSAIYLSALVGGARLKIADGYVSSDGKLNIPVRLENFKLEDSIPQSIEVLGLFPVKKYWQMFSPRGVINIDGVLSRSFLGKWEWHARVHFSKGSLAYRNLTCKNIDIVADCRNDEIALVKGSWDLRGGHFELTPGGKLNLGGAKTIIEGLGLSFENFQLSPDIWKAFPEGNDVWDLLSPEGPVSGVASWNGDLSLDNLSAKLTLRDFKAVCNEVPHPASDIAATLTLKNSCLDLDVDGKMFENGGEVKVTGKVWPFERPYGAAVDIRIDVTGARVTKKIREVFQKDWREDVKDVWDTLEFSAGKGLLNVSVDIKMLPGSREHITGEVYYRVVINGKGLESRCIYFPYLIDGVTGTVVVEKDLPIVFSDIKAKKGVAEFDVSGDLFPGDKGLEIRKLVVKGKNVPLDNSLKNALGDEAKVWDEIRPRGGLIDIVVELSKAPSKEITWQAKARIKDTSASYRGFPYRVHHLKGNLELKPRHFILKNIVGTSGKGKVRLSGWVAPPKFNINIQASGIAIDKKMRNALCDLSPEIHKILDRFRLKGTLDGKIRLRKRKCSAPVDWRVFLKFKKLRGYYRDFKYSLSHLRGEVRIDPHGFEIRSCRGQSGKGKVNITGKQDKNGLVLNILAENIRLNEKLYKALSKEQRTIWDQFKPDGRADVDVKVSVTGDQTDYALRFIPRKCSMYYQKFPYRIYRITAGKRGGVSIHTKSFSGEKKEQAHSTNVVFEGIEGRHGSGVFQANGSFYTFPGEKTRLELLINAHDIAVDRDLRHALGQFFPKVMKSLAPRGKVKQMQLDLEQYDGRENYLRYDAKIKAMNVTMKKDSFLERAAGDVTLKGFSYKKRHHAQGFLKNGEVVLHGMVVTDVETPIKLFDDYLQFSPINGAFYQGSAHGWLVIDTSEYGAFKGSCSISRSQLDPVLKALDKHSKKGRTSGKIDSDKGANGSLFGEISFQGNTHNSDLMTGRGWIQARNGEIWQMPLLLAIFDIFSLPQRPAFHEGNVRFSISRSNFEINSLRLHSSLLSISGSGVIDFDGNIRLELLTHFAPQYLPRIPLVNQVLDTIKQEFFELYVTGTLSEPSITLPQWETLRDLIK